MSLYLPFLGSEETMDQNLVGLGYEGRHRDEVAKLGSFPKSLQRATIPAQKWAILAHLGPMTHLG